MLTRNSTIAVSKSRLRRITGSLKAALISILHMSKTQQPVIDYGSLSALSNASRIDAIRTMDDLSQRLHKPSSTSLKSTRSKKSTSSESKPHSNRRSSGKKIVSEQHQASTRKDYNHQKTAPRDPLRDHVHSPTSGRASSKPDKPPKPPAHRAAAEKKPGKLIKPKMDYEELVANQRVSYISISSDSTKLGEIPYRGSRLFKHPPRDAGDSINQRATFPLYTYQAPQQEKVGLFRRLFR